MTRSTTQYTSAYGSLASYKGYQGAISATINAVLARTADTGQVNWNTIAAEPTVTRDYEVFAFNDSLQATRPIYVRFDYIGGSISTNRVNVTVGTSTDGAGNLGGVTIPAAPLHQYTPGSAPRSAYASSDGSYLMLAYNIYPAGSGNDGLACVVIERTRNPDGSINGDGYMCWRWNASQETPSSPNQAYFAGTTSRIFGVANSAQPASTFDLGAFIPNVQNAATYFQVDTAYGFPVYGWAPMPQGASKALLLGVNSDFPRDSEITLRHYGVDMKFFSLGPASTATQVAYAATSSTALSKLNLTPLLRWE